MRKYVILAVTLVSFAAAFPEKGKDFFISATLKRTTGSGSVYVLSPCEPLTAIHGNKSQTRFHAYDRAGESTWFKGDWSTRVHLSADECRASLEVHGDADVKYDGTFYNLVGH